MDSSINTKALINKFKTLCISCNQDLGNTTTTSIHELLPHIEPATTFFEGLKQLSDFRKFSIDQVPPRGCKTCFLKTSGCLRFISLCNTSAFIIEGHILNQEETKQDVINADISEACSTSLCVESNNAYEIEVVEPKVEPTHSIDIKEEHPPQETHMDTNISNGDKQIAVRRRILIKHKRRQKKGNEPDQEKVECKTCNKWFTKNYIKYHLRLHTGGEFYRCKICDKAFTMPSNYYSHMHHCHNTEIPPFLCNQCGRGFKRGWLLQHHIKIDHNMERPYVCKICGKTFTNSTTMKCHETTHSDERPFQCGKCPKRFSLKKLLRQHNVTHAEVRPFACEFCDKRFTQRHCLRTHQAKTCQGLKRT